MNKKSSMYMMHAIRFNKRKFPKETQNDDGNIKLKGK